MTDDSDAEINALSTTWPSSKHLLCIFHIGQAVWRWLFDCKNCIPKEHRRNLMEFFQAILYATNPRAAEEAYLNAQGYIGTYLPTYPLWNKYLNMYWEKKDMWCLAYRNETVRGHHTNNFSEVCVRIFKDHVLARVKAYNIITLVDFSSTVLEEYYKRRLINFSNSWNAEPRLFFEKIRHSCSVEEGDIEQTNEHMFSVKGLQDVYQVDIKSGCCSCRSGMFGKFCKHQFAVFNFHHVWGKNFPAISPNDKHEIAKLALGQKAPPLEFYLPFVEEKHSTSPIVAQAQEVVTQQQNELPTDEDPIDRIAIENGDEAADQIRKELVNEFGNILKKFNSSTAGMKKALQRLRRITSEGQCETMLHTMGNNVAIRRKAGVAIRVQPTSISRRSASVTRGTKRLASGRPAKRAHNLSLNIKLNQPNATKH